MAKRLFEERTVVVRGVDEPRRPQRAAAGPAAKATRRGRTVTVDLAESPLGWLKARGHISARQFDAGEQLRGDWELAQLAPSVTMRWDAARVNRQPGSTEGPLTPAETQVAAKRRFDAAVAAAGPGLDNVLWRIVCAGEGMREAEAALGWPARAGKVVLCLALDRLAEHYRMK